MTRGVLPACVVVIVTVAACATRDPQPASIRLGEDACASCRMTIVSTQNAAQLIAPGSEPIMFDELGCLRDYLAKTPVPEEAAVFVADHRTGEWIDAYDAVYTQTRVATPMASGLLAHADVRSRDADPQAADGAALTAEAVLGARGRRMQP